LQPVALYVLLAERHHILAPVNRSRPSANRALLDLTERSERRRCASQPPQAPCATAIVAKYTAEMIAAGCVGEHFDDAQCAVIKDERDAKEKAAGCTQ